MYAQVTFGELRVQLRNRYDAVPFWTSRDEVLGINDALRTWNAFTGTWRRRHALETVPAEPWYVLPGCVSYTTRVTFNDQPLNLDSVDSMDMARPGWDGEVTAQAGIKPGVPPRPLMWMPAGVAMIAIWPSDSVGCNSLVIDGVVHTPVLAKDDDFVDLGKEDQDLLLGEAIHVMAFKEGGARWKATGIFHKEFIAGAAKRNSRFKSSAIYRRIMGLDVGRFSRPVANTQTALDAQGA